MFTATRATAAPRVVSVENGGLLFTDNQAGVTGTDAGFSAPIGNQTLWLFGDVFLLDPKKPDKPWVGGVSNCALLVPKGHGAPPLRSYRFLTDPKTGVARQVIPLRPGETEKTRLWPNGHWYDAAHHKLYLYYGTIAITGEGAFAFQELGRSLSVADTSRPLDLTFERLKPPASDYLWADEDGPVFGNCVIADAPGAGDWLYVYGEGTKPDTRGGRLARVRKDRITDPAAYEYYAGGDASPRWSRDKADSALVKGLTDFPSEYTVRYNRYLGGYLAVHQVILGEKIRLSLAKDPWGPFTPIAEIGAPHQALQKGNCYAGKEHPELEEDGGRVIYITYVDQQRYWLQLLKVTLAK